MRLYSYWRSSSAWRVRIALAHKRVEHELVTVQLQRGEQNQPEFRQLNAMGQVPVLETEEDGKPLQLTQSIAIIEYLEERFRERPLLPADREGRARARELAQIVNSGMQPMQNSSLQRAFEAAGLDVAVFRKQALEKGLAALESIAAHTAGKFLVRDGVTLADIYLVPQLYAARRFEIDLAPFPTLRRVDEACAALAEFQSAHPNVQPDFEPPREPPRDG